MENIEHLLGKVHNVDCLEFMRQLPDNCVDLVLTDPPYPDYYVEEYKYFDGIISPLAGINSKQLIFWSAKIDFPLKYSAIHIWDKRVGCGSMYERIFEVNGGKSYKVYSQYLINSTVAAKFTGDIYTGHKSQKPIKLICDLVEEYTKVGDIVFDPFMGSGTTAVACERLGRKWFGCELEPRYVAIANKRIEAERAQLKLF